MRIVVGINHETYHPVLDVLPALRFGSAEIQLVHVVEHLLQDLLKVPFDPVASAAPQDAIASTMRETSADLLILGAQGHGFWERLRLGSLSYYETIATDHNVLVLRT